MDGIGLDIGTTKICAVLLDINTGRVKAVRARPNTAAMIKNSSFEALQDPQLILDICRNLIQELAGLSGRVESIGVCGQMHGILYLDQSGQPVSPLITWQDERGNCLMEAGKSYSQRLTELTGYHMATGYGLTTHFYNLHKGILPADAAAFCSIGDYVAAALCGRTIPVVHPSIAASFGLFDLTAGAFDKKALLNAGIKPDILPPVSGKESLLGTTPEGIPVCTAIGDNQASVFGSLNQDAQVLINVGTGSQISVLCDTIQNRADIEYRPYVGGHFLSVGSPLCGGHAYQMVKDFLESAAKLMGYNGPTTDSYARMQAAAEAVYERTPGLTVDTRFRGTRNDPLLRGSITGIGESNFAPAQLILGVLRGIAEEMVHLYVQMPDCNPSFLCGSGNGIRKNPLLRRILTERFKMPLFMPVYEEEAAYGASLIGACAAGSLPSLSAAQALIRYL